MFPYTGCSVYDAGHCPHRRWSSHKSSFFCRRFHSYVILKNPWLNFTIISNDFIMHSSDWTPNSVVQCSSILLRILDVSGSNLGQETGCVTSWIRVLGQAPQLVKTFPAFYTRRVIALFARARQSSLSWASLIQSTPSQPFFLCSVLISMLRFSKWSFYFRFPHRCAEPFAPYVQHISPFLCFLILSPLIVHIWWEETGISSLISFVFLLRVLQTNWWSTSFWIMAASIHIHPNLCFCGMFVYIARW